MKNFNFKKTEHHQVSKFFDAVISEEKIRSILEQEDYDEDEIDADLMAYLLLKKQGLSTDRLTSTFQERHGIEFTKDLLSDFQAKL